MSTRVLRAHRFRLDPGSAQVVELAHYAEGRRKAWNWGLALTRDLLGLDRCADRLRLVGARPGKKPYRYLGKIDLINLFTKGKVGEDWTQGVPVKAFEYAFEDLANATSAYFKARGTRRRVGFPRFIPANTDATFTLRGKIEITAGVKGGAKTGRRLNQDVDMDVRPQRRIPGTVTLPGLSPLPVRGGTGRLRREIEALHGVIREATVSRNHGLWYLAVLIERDAIREVPAIAEILLAVKENKDLAVGLDVGLHDLATLSDGTVIPNPRFFRRGRRRLRKLARSAGRSQRVREQAVLLAAITRHAEILNAWNTEGRKGPRPDFPRLALPPKSHRHRKKDQKLARAHQRIANARNTYTAQVVTTLVPARVVVGTEDLTIANLIKNHSLAASISDAGWRGFSTPWRPGPRIEDPSSSRRNASLRARRPALPAGRRIPRSRTSRSAPGAVPSVAPPTSGI